MDSNDLQYDLDRSQSFSFAFTASDDEDDDHDNNAIDIETKENNPILETDYTDDDFDLSKYFGNQEEEGQIDYKDEDYDLDKYFLNSSNGLKNAQPITPSGTEEQTLDKKVISSPRSQERQMRYSKSRSPQMTLNLLAEEAMDMARMHGCEFASSQMAHDFVFNGLHEFNVKSDIQSANKNDDNYWLDSDSEDDKLGDKDGWLHHEGDWPLNYFEFEEEVPGFCGRKHNRTSGSHALKKNCFIFQN